MDRVACRASPNLALVKYWGKLDRGRNLPATPSLGLALGGLETLTLARIAEGGEDSLLVDGRPDLSDRARAFFHEARAVLRVSHHFEVRSESNFPARAGLASSSSGFAALALTLARLSGRAAEGAAVAELARRGSASAARALCGGFSYFPRGGRAALPLLGAEHWPELRILVAVVARAPKSWPSREAMAATAATSPYYRAWLRDAPRIARRARTACADRELDELGRAMLLSYSRMHAALLASDPPRLYWTPGTLAILETCARLRSEGFAAYETVDAGPQVKILCREAEVRDLAARLEGCTPEAEFLLARPGPAPQLYELDVGEPDPPPLPPPRLEPSAARVEPIGVGGLR